MTILSVRSTAPPSFLPAATPRRRRTLLVIGTNLVEYSGDVAPTQADVDAFLIAQAAAQAAAARIGDIDLDVAAFSFGGQTLAGLKAMTNTEFNAWWAANVTSLAQANVVLRFLAKAALHRLL